MSKKVLFSILVGSMCFGGDSKTQEQDTDELYARLAGNANRVTKQPIEMCKKSYSKANLISACEEGWVNRDTILNKPVSK